MKAARCPEYQTAQALFQLIRMCQTPSMERDMCRHWVIREVSFASPGWLLHPLPSFLSDFWGSLNALPLSLSCCSRLLLCSGSHVILISPICHLGQYINDIRFGKTMLRLRHKALINTWNAKHVGNTHIFNHLITIFWEISYTMSHKYDHIET